MISYSAATHLLEHGLGIIDDELKAWVVEGRGVFREMLSADAPNAIPSRAIAW